MFKHWSKLYQKHSSRRQGLIILLYFIKLSIFKYLVWLICLSTLRFSLKIPIILFSSYFILTEDDRKPCWNITIQWFDIYIQHFKVKIGQDGVYYKRIYIESINIVLDIKDNLDREHDHVDFYENYWLCYFRTVEFHKYASHPFLLQVIIIKSKRVSCV